MKVSWITIFLFFAVATTHFSTVNTKTTFSQRMALLFLHTMCCYAQFTVMHDASHWSLAPGVPFINDLFGWMSQIWLGPSVNFWTFRYIHRMHHKYTNDPEKDPDIFAKSGSFGGPLLMPLRWLFIDVAYWKYYVPKIIPGYHTRPLKEVFVVWLYHVAIFSVIISTIYTGHFHILWWNWILPSRLAKLMLAFAFDYLPHKNHKDTPQTNVYKTTHYISTPRFLEPIVSMLLFNHNYHIIHHLYPHIPYYNYATGWLKHKDFLLNDAKVDVLRLFPYLGKENIS